MGDDELAVLEARWRELLELNTANGAAIARRGTQLDLDPIVRQTWLEHILRHLAGEEGVLRCRIATQERIAETLDQAAASVNRAMLLAQPNGKG